MGKAQTRARRAPPAPEQRGQWGLKRALLEEGNNAHYKAWQLELLDYAIRKLDGIPREIATTAMRARRLTDKQAWWLAKALIEGGHIHPLAYVDYGRE